jgi:hypothetical protein
MKRRVSPLFPVRQWRFVGLALLLIAALGVCLWTFIPGNVPESGVHYHAAFQVYIGDELVDFSGLKYMHIEPCTDDPTDEVPTEAEEQIEKAHLHSRIGDVVHVHREGAVWRDLFTNLQYVFPSPVFGFVNDQRVDGILDAPIEKYGRVLFVSGAYSDLEGKARDIPSFDRIKEVERMSEDCGT